MEGTLSREACDAMIDRCGGMFEILWSATVYRKYKPNDEHCSFEPSRCRRAVRYRKQALNGENDEVSAVHNVVFPGD